ncbi:MAG: hypothetical protein Q4C23_02845 [Mycoplasmatota bacterium]|nr:hypothetical protein [Mycoplasmatota bacterium]
MENKENLNICAELNKQRDMIQNLCSISSKILEVLRGAIPIEDNECVSENCILDTQKNNSKNLLYLERNLNEIASKIIG